MRDRGRGARLRVKIARAARRAPGRARARPRPRLEGAARYFEKKNFPFLSVSAVSRGVAVGSVC